MKRCTLCQDQKELEEFCKDPTHKDGYSSRCRACKKKTWNKETWQKWYDKNKEKQLETSRKWDKANQAKRMLTWARSDARQGGFLPPDISFIDLEMRIKKAGGMCEWCNSMPKRLILEHNHLTGVVRGLVCDRCNHLASALDDPRLVIVMEAIGIKRIEAPGGTSIIS